MYRLLRRLAIGSGLMMTGAAVAVFFLYRAATAPVPEYQALLERTKLQRDNGELEQDRQELESQLAALYSDTQTAERWETVLTAQQINGWLATRLEKEIPELSQQGLTDLRVMMKPGVTTLAMHADLHGLKAVVAIDLAPFVADDGSLALELAGARVGSAPLPTKQILDQLNASMGEEGLPGRWTQNNGHPVLLIDLVDHVSPRNGALCVLETIEVREGELYAAGVSEDPEPRVAVLPD